ncbi:MAG: carboxypeptidase regulatory-like domain-containing protein, partial [Chloroflexia bacterium]|nr:carboxypeptidase regulatory-like domain-containing protein [Chloroflexia bacterium]
AEVNPAGATRWPVALRPASLAGALLDEQTNAPIAGARVAALGTDGTGPETTSGADGTYRLDGVPADARLVVEASDYGAVEQPLGLQTRLDMALKRSVVTGLVQDATGSPIEGARVSVADGSATTLTGPDGTYRLLGASSPELLIAASGYGEITASVPPTGQVDVSLEPERIRAIFANIGVLGDPERLGRLIEIANTTEINAIVIDVKQDYIYYDTAVPFFRDIPGMVTPVFDPAELLALLDENDIYSIARTVVFKDPVVAEARPDLAVRDEVTGDLWRDMNGSAWVNAFDQELWQANADFAAELAQLGFDEVQYDYIRFPSDGDLRTADFGNDYTEELRRAAITGAVAVGAEQTRANGAAFAIDLFPTIALFGNDQGIGQTLQDLAPLADYVCLMIYPSHYELGNIPTADGHPNDFPAETVTYTLEMAEQLVPGTTQKMRPWLQDFNYPAEGYRPYDAADVREQIDATEESGASGWLLWNAAGEFEVEALRAEG